MGQLFNDIITYNDERQLDQRELAAARVGLAAAGRLADPALIVEPGQKTTTNA